jgi:hypothetical protein
VSLNPLYDLQHKYTLINFKLLLQANNKRLGSVKLLSGSFKRGFVKSASILKGMTPNIKNDIIPKID